MKTEDSKEKLKVAKNDLRTARRLLTRALDEIPFFDDGRNDRLISSIEKFLSIK